MDGQTSQTKKSPKFEKIHLVYQNPIWVRELSYFHIKHQSTSTSTWRRRRRRRGPGAVCRGAGGGAAADYIKPQAPIEQRPQWLYKAPTNYTKSKKPHRYPENIRQITKTVNKSSKTYWLTCNVKYSILKMKPARGPQTIIFGNWL